MSEGLPPRPTRRGVRRDASRLKQSSEQAYQHDIELGVVSGRDRDYSRRNTGEVSIVTAPPKADSLPLDKILILDDTMLNLLKDRPSQNTGNTQLKAAQQEETKLVEKKKLLSEWGDRMKALAWMHTKSFEFFRVVSLGIMIPNIMLSTASGALNLFESNKRKCTDPADPAAADESGLHMTSLVTGVISLTAAGLSTIYHFLHLGERQSQHLTIAAQFEKLARQISVQSILSETDERTYMNLAEFIKDCNEQYDQLTDQMPHIPDFIIRKYYKERNSPNGISDIYYFSL